MRTLTIMLLLLVVFSIPVLADSGSYWYDFPNPQPFKPSEDEIEHPDVVMVDEFVSIVLGAEGAVVNAEFTFRNEGAAQTVPMYFPLEHYSGMTDFSREELNGIDFISEEESTQGEYPKWNEFYGIEEITNGKYSLSGSVNDSKVEVKVILEQAGRVEDSLGEHDYYDADYFYRDIYAIYEVTFAAGETLTLSTEYQQWYDFPPKGAR